MSTTTPTSRDILLAAADHCDEVGLRKGELWPGEGEGKPYVDGAPCCIEGHVIVAAGGRDAMVYPAAYRAAWAELGRNFFLALPGAPLAVSWSDDPTRTASDVSSALRAAAGGAR